MNNILLLHGWGYSSYSKITNHSTPWHNKQEFINILEKYYNVYTPFFPGFCGEDEPNEAYDLNDYARYIDHYIKSNNLKIDFVLGNSFGGEVAVRYKSFINSSMPIILIVPAILRKSTNSKKFINTPKMIEPLRNKIRDFYVIYIKKTPEMKYGTKFLRQSYQKIVRYNLIDELKMFNANEVLILLGKHDSMVDTDTIFTELSKKYGANIYQINGGHEITETHKEELLSHILKFTSNR